MNVRKIFGDCRTSLVDVPSRSVHCCITSPPYFNLRSYLPKDSPLKDFEIGTELTIEDYIRHLVDAFREVHRVLRDDGVLWVNLGDSYTTGAHAGDAHLCGSDDKVRQGYQSGGPPFQNLDDGRKEKSSTRIFGNATCRALEQAIESLSQIQEHIRFGCGHAPNVDSSRLIQIQRFLTATLDQVRIVSLSVEHLLSSLESTISESALPLLDNSRPSDMLSACLTSLTTFSVCARQFVDMSVDASKTEHCTAGSVSLYEELQRHIQCTSSYCSLLLAWGEIKPQHSIGKSLKPKDLMLVPYRVALALQNDGWYLRSAMPWIKRNPKPESVEDRPSNAIETVFLFSKSERYFFDAEAIRMPGSMASVERSGRAIGSTHKHVNGVPGQTAHTMSQPRPNTNKERGHPRQDQGNLDSTTREDQCGGTRNRRNTDWFMQSFQGLVTGEEDEPLAFLVNPAGYKGAHTATFPKKLIEPMILAGTSIGCCATCQAPFRRVVVKGAPNLEHQRACGGDQNGAYHGQNQKNYDVNNAERASTVKARILAGMVERTTVAWEYTCKCPDAGAYQPLHLKILRAPRCTVLDLFGGSGTVGEVATELGRDAILCDLDPSCEKQMDARKPLTVQPTLV